MGEGRGKLLRGSDGREWGGPGGDNRNWGGEKRENFLGIAVTGGIKTTHTRTYTRMRVNRKQVRGQQLRPMDGKRIQRY